DERSALAAGLSLPRDAGSPRPAARALQPLRSAQALRARRPRHARRHPRADEHGTLLVDQHGVLPVPLEARGARGLGGTRDPALDGEARIGEGARRHFDRAHFMVEVTRKDHELVRCRGDDDLAIAVETQLAAAKAARQAMKIVGVAERASGRIAPVVVAVPAVIT